jgi:hypothetical protein
MLSFNKKCPKCDRPIARTIHSIYWQKEGINASIIPSNGIPAVCTEGHLFVKLEQEQSV